MCHYTLGPIDSARPSAGISARPAGGLVVGGVDAAGRAALRALTADGSSDTTFGPFGTSYTSASSGLAQAGSNALHTRPDGSFVLVSGTPGTSTWSADAGDDFAVVSFTADGLPDTAFGAGGVQTTGFGSNVRLHRSVGCSPAAADAGGRGKPAARVRLIDLDGHDDFRRPSLPQQFLFHESPFGSITG